jgi:hypothetical protein
LVTAGSLFGLDAIATSYSPSAKRVLDRIPKSLRQKLELAALILAVFYAGFATWELELQTKNDEHAARMRAEQQPSAPRDQQQIIDRLSGDLVAARAEIDALKQQREEEGKARHLGKLEREKLDNAFKPLVSVFPELRISAPSDGEAQGYAGEFMSAFNNLGIEVARVGLIIPTSLGTGKNSGLQIVVKDLKKVPDKANRFYQAMLLAGFEPEGGTLDTLGDDDFELVISTKPRL